MEEALDLVRADLHRHVLGDRVPTPGGVPARAAGMDEVQLVARDDDLIDLEGHAVVEPLDGDAGQGVLVVVVEHVAQPVGIEDGPARQDAVFAVCDERDLVDGGTIRPRPAERTPPAGDAVFDPSRPDGRRDDGRSRHGPEVPGALASRA